MPLAVENHVRSAVVAKLPLDSEGFLLDQRMWDRDLAQQLAELNGLGRLGPTQWLIIDFVRDKYFRLGALPPMGHVCRRLGVEREAVKKSFGSCRLLWQVAGLPNPGGEAISYMA